MPHYIDGFVLPIPRDRLEDEAIVFGWVVFESREARDLANEKVASDPRMAELINSSNSGFDAERMAYGGFRPLVLSSDATPDDGS